MSVVSNNILAGASGQGGGGYQIERSLRFNPGDSAYLNRTPSSSGNLKTWTWSGWVKRSNSGAGHTNDFFSCGVNIHNGGAGGAQANAYFDVDGTIQVYEYSGGYGYNYRTTQVFRDFSAWYHIVISLDTTDLTAGDRVKIYINGDRVTSFSTSNAPTLNFEGEINKSGVQHYISDTAAPFNGYLADVHFIDGQALAPTDFGETDDNGVWQPKKFAGIYNQEFAENWESQVTGSAIDAGRAISMTFDGDATTRSAAAAGTTLTFTPTSPITGISAVVIKADRDSGASSSGLVLNGTNISSNWSSGTSEQTISVNNLTSLSWQTEANSQWWGVYYIKIVKNGVTYELLQRPSSTFNSFHLDFADNSSNAALGTDTSGNDNTWTVNNLEAAPGGGTPVSSATGALPVYNTTDSLGKVKGTGTRTDSNSSYLVVAVPFDAGNTVDVSNSINTSSTTKSFTTTGSFASNASNIFYGSSTDFNGSSCLGTTSSSSDFTFGTGDFTVEYWANYDDISASNSQRGDFQTSTTSGGVTTSLSTGVINSFYPSGTLNFNVAGATAGVIAGIAAGTWYHIAFVRENGSVRLYKDGILQATTSNTGNVTATYLAIGGYYSATYFINGRMQDFRVYKGVAKYTSNFTLVAPGNPALQAGTDSLLDTPTNGDTASDTGAGGEVVGNYATLNPLALPGGGTLSDGNLKYLSGGGWDPTSATIGVNSGKWYWEYLFEGTNMECGITAHPNTDNWIGNYQESIGIGNGGDLYLNGDGGTNPSGWSTIATGSIVGNELDLDNGTFRHYVNGVAQSYATQSLDTSLTWFPAGSVYASSHLTYNFGQRGFAYQNAGTNRPSADFKCLTTANLPEPTIADGSKYFDTKLYDGTGSALTISNYGFSPDLAWIKCRNATLGHNLVDTVRGANYTLFSNTTGSESTQTDRLTAFTSDGFTLGTNAAVNTSSNTHVAWAWDAGSSNTTIAASALNSSVYDQSQTWSSGKDGDRSDYPVTNVFDASLTTVGYGSVNQTITVTLPGGSIALTSLRVRADRAGTATGKFYVNGNDYTSQIASGTNWNTITGETSITSIGYASDTGSNFVGLYAVEVNGKQLVDYGVSVPNVPSIASTVRANPSAGFSIVSYTGNLSGNGSASVAHGLNAIPELIITKQRNSASRWPVQHKDLADNHLLVLNTTDASTSYPFGDLTNKTSSIFSTNYTAGMNTNGDDFIAYCFAPVEGYSAMGSFLATGSADSAFVFTGFRPRWILGKATSTTFATGDWFIYDTERETFNSQSKPIGANTSNVEDSGGYYYIDVLSNGFKIRGAYDMINKASETYIYLAFAEHPFKTARAR